MNTKFFTRGIFALLTLGAGMFLTGCQGNIDPIDPPVIPSDPVSDIVSNMVTVHSKTFEMVPGRNVTLSTFYMSRYEVTQSQWYAVMGTKPSGFTGATLPVERVSWNMIVGTAGATMVIDGMTYYEDGFVYKLNQLTGKKFRLPTEAEWQFAASGGIWSMGYTYSGSNTIDDVAWYDGNSAKTHPVGDKMPNELGLYDMSGNVWEWCYDAWSATLATGPFTNPVGTAGSDRVLRGGGCSSGASSAAVLYRNNFAPGNTNSNVGFRLACSAN